MELGSRVALLRPQMGNCGRNGGGLAGHSRPVLSKLPAGLNRGNGGSLRRCARLQTGYDGRANWPPKRSQGAKKWLVQRPAGQTENRERHPWAATSVDSDQPCLPRPPSLQGGSRKRTVCGRGPSLHPVTSLRGADFRGSHRVREWRS